MTSVSDYPSVTIGDKRIDAFSPGTESCNIGDTEAMWEECSVSNNHPFIRTAMFKLYNGRLEQIGTSWVKHGWLATNEDTCTGTCSNQGVAGNRLRPGCTDIYSGSTNAHAPYLGRSSEINAYLGTRAPGSQCGVTRTMLCRTDPPAIWMGQFIVQVDHDDLDPNLNPGALYFVQGHYVSADEAAAGNANNSASYRRVLITYTEPSPPPPTGCPTGDTYAATETGETYQEEPAIYAWKKAYPDVMQVDAQVPGEGLFILAARAYPLPDGYWRYEYAVMNLNSDRSAGSFSVPLPEFATVRNPGFHDVDYHSGEIFSNEDWTPTISSNQISWATTPFSTNQLASALRWSMMNNYWFEANVEPEVTTVTLGLFKPGTPAAINVEILGPSLEFIDCNQNGRADHCDIDCQAVGCNPESCGALPQSFDCNGNAVPDECEEDCNANGMVDSCDVAPGECEGCCVSGDSCLPKATCCASNDCNGDGLPDECQEDCDHDGVPDDCEQTLDCDGDGILDCDDQCVCSTPPGGCDLDPYATCRLPAGFCVDGLTRSQCLANMGTPVCGEEGMLCFERPPCPSSACRDGCLIGDYDWDGDFDLIDLMGEQDCFSGPNTGEGFVPPSAICLNRFDFDNDGDVDAADAKEVQVRLTGPG